MLRYPPTLGHIMYFILNRPLIPKWGVNPLQQLNNLESREMMNGAGKKKNKVQLHKFVFSLSDPYFI